MPVSDFIGREHPALVHLPIAASLLLVLSLGLWCSRGAQWCASSRLLAWTALLGGLGAAESGLLWAHSMGLLPPGGFLPIKASLFSTHEALALGGFLPGIVALALVERGRPRAALIAALLWAVLWGAAGHWGGRMVFPEPDPAQSQLFLEAPWATSVLPKSS